MLQNLQRTNIIATQNVKLELILSQTFTTEQRHERIQYKERNLAITTVLLEQLIKWMFKNKNKLFSIFHLPLYMHLILTLLITPKFKTDFYLYFCLFLT